MSPVGLLTKAKNIQQNSWSGEATLRCARVFDLDVFEVVDCFKFHEFSKFRDADIWFYPKNHSLTDCGQLCVLSLVLCVPNVLKYFECVSNHRDLSDVQNSSQCRIRTVEDFGNKMRGSIIFTNQGEINKKREEKHYCSTTASTFWEYWESTT